jgi:hypothetical protein
VTSNAQNGAGCRPELDGSIQDRNNQGVERWGTPARSIAGRAVVVPFAGRPCSVEAQARPEGTPHNYQHAQARETLIGNRPANRRKMKLLGPADGPAARGQRSPTVASPL